MSIGRTTKDNEYKALHRKFKEIWRQKGCVDESRGILERRCVLFKQKVSKPQLKSQKRLRIFHKRNDAENGGGNPSEGM